MFVNNAGKQADSRFGDSFLNAYTRRANDGHMGLLLPAQGRSKTVGRIHRICGGWIGH